MQHVIRRYRFDLFLLLCIPYALLAWRFWLVVDDAFISFRYARNFALGHGLRYNLGAHLPVEGYSNFLWVINCSLFELLHLDVALWAPLLSATSGLLLLWLVFDVLRRRLGLNLVVVCLATLTLGCFPPFAVWSTGGLETMPFALLVFLTFERLVLRPEGPDGFGGGIAALLLALMRVEGIGWALVILVLALLSRSNIRQRNRRPLFTFLLIVGTGFAVYYIWRYSYYQLPLPNTAYTKSSLDAERLLRGAKYVATHVLTFLTPLLMIPGSVVALRKGRGTIGWSVVTLAWAFPIYAIVVTGDWLHMGRFLVPGFAFNTILVAWLLQDIWAPARARRATSLTVAAATIVLGLLPGWNQHIVPPSVRARFVARHFARAGFQSEYEWWLDERTRLEKWICRGRALRSYAAQRYAGGERPSLVLGPIGAVGYYSDLYIYDRFGLVTAEVGRAAARTDLALPSPGHDKHVRRTYFLKYEPTIWADAAFQHVDPRPLARICRRRAEEMQRTGSAPLLQEKYGPDIARVSGDQPDCPVAYIVVWRRLPAGQSPQEAWGAFQARLDVLAGGNHLPAPRKTY